ncbi:solute carrier family 23 member 3 [Esox lucius]|uniref:Solute carrier family 23 member 3 n=1 Tax=Esox lucius TaxID=8010 RepID=A0A3P9A215_ESOLU|nr:solute carrier family 23 member 3 [Esox lucius]
MCSQGVGSRRLKDRERRRGEWIMKAHSVHTQTTLQGNGESDLHLPVETKRTNRTDVPAVIQRPPHAINLLLALQHVFVQCSLLVLVLGVLQPHLPSGDGDEERFLSSMLFYSSLSTLLQSCLGTCLPVVQVPSLEGLVPALVLAAQTVGDSACRGRCGENKDQILPRTIQVRELQGVTVTVGLIQLVLGLTGLGGVVLRHCGPLVMAPVLCLLGFSIYREAALLCSDHWAIAALVIILLVGMSQHLRSFLFPTCLRLPQLPVFRMISVLLPVLSVWAMCAVLETLGYLHLHSVSELLPVLKSSNSSLLAPPPSEKNLSSSTVHWLRLPLAVEAGLPLWSARCIAAGVVAALSSSVSSVGVYMLTARVLGAPPPPPAAFNRGLGAQGLGSVVAGLMGAPLGLSSSVPNGCLLRISQAGSRWTVQLAAILGLALGLSPRLTQLLTSVPLAIYGAVLSVTYAIAMAMGVTYFQFTHIDSGRNIFNTGFALFMSLVLPHWFCLRSDFIDTGMTSVDVLLQSLLTSPVLLVGIFSFLLDNTVSGSLAERGLDSAESRKTGRTLVSGEPGHWTTGHQQEVALVYDSPYLLTRLWNLPGFRTVAYTAFRIPDDGDVL